MSRSGGRIIYMIFFLFIMIFGEGCIHEYPHAINPAPNEPGTTPESVVAYIEVEFDLTWENMLHKVEFSTKAREGSHRFIIEVVKNNELVYRDIYYMDEEEFSTGRLRHRIGEPLKADVYEIGIWFDKEDDKGDYSYLSEGLDKIFMTNFTTSEWEMRHCGYVKEVLDLSEFSGSESNNTYLKKLQLKHAVGRFELIATDINEFIDEQESNLLAGESFSVEIIIETGGGDIFNLYTEEIGRGGEKIELSGHLRLPFAEYESLKIAEGSIFCKEEDEVMCRLRVRNSSLSIVSETEYFTFPIKRGYVTSIEGSFLTNPVGGLFSIDNVWEGEIEYEI